MSLTFRQVEQALPLDLYEKIVRMKIEKDMHDDIIGSILTRNVEDISIKDIWDIDTHLCGGKTTYKDLQNLLKLIEKMHEQFRTPCIYSARNYERQLLSNTRLDHNRKLRFLLHRFFRVLALVDDDQYWRPDCGYSYASKLRMRILRGVEYLGQKSKDNDLKLASGKNTLDYKELQKLFGFRTD